MLWPSTVEWVILPGTMIGGQLQATARIACEFNVNIRRRAAGRLAGRTAPDASSVLAGDSPIDWAKVTSAAGLRAPPSRDAFVTSLVHEQVLARGRRALLCYGLTGLFHGTGMTGAFEQHVGQRIYVIADLVPLAGDPGGLAAKLSRYPRNTVIPTAGTWLGSLKAGLYVAETHQSLPARPGSVAPACPVRAAPPRPATTTSPATPVPCRRLVPRPGTGACAGPGRWL